jgi:RNA polymerase primary sigma factor
MFRTPRQAAAAQSPLATYLRDINNTPMLGAAEEKALARRIQRGDSAARDRMVRANLRLVVKLARAYTGRGLDLPDLIAEGNLGLLRAVETFDPSMNNRFSTYASFWIKQSMRRTLLNTSRTIRLPAHMVDLLTKWQRVAALLREELDRPPTPEEIAARLHLSHKKLHIIKKLPRVYQAPSQTEETETERCLDDSLLDPRSKPPAAGLSEAEDLHQLLHLLEEMSPREATVLRMRFGLDDQQPKTLQMIGEQLGLTRERVRQIEHDALDKLSRIMEIR